MMQFAFQTSPAASAAAAQVFKQACVQGTLKLSPERGRILKEYELTDFTSVLRWGRPTKNKTVIKFNDPPATYLVFADYGKAQPKSIARECIVVSRVITLDDAMAALIGTAPDLEPRLTWISNMYLREWTIDAPRRGFRARMRVRDDRSILLDVGSYETAIPTLPSPGITHQ
jgi:hypothetical protein